MTTEPDNILDDIFHGCALRAFLEQARLEPGWQRQEATRLRAFELYESALAARWSEQAQIDKREP